MSTNIRLSCRGIPAFLFLFTLLTSAARAAVPCQVAELSPADDPTRQNAFGSSAAISGDYAVFGAPQDSEVDQFAGAAYVFKRVKYQWVEQTKLLGSNIGFWDFFGYAVDIDGDRVVVGAPFSDPVGGEVGQAYVFQRAGDSWTEMAQLIPSVSSIVTLQPFAMVESGSGGISPVLR